MPRYENRSPSPTHCHSRPCLPRIIQVSLMSQRRCVTSWGVGDFYSFPWTSSRRQHRVRFHNGYQKSYNVPLPHAVTHFPPINPLGNVLYPSSTSPPTWGPQTEDGTSRDTRFDQNRTYPQLHPLLTREHSSGSKTLLDLSSHAFSPKRSLGVGTPIRPFTYDELLEPATVPPVRRINVAANFLPDWAAGLHENSALESLSRWKSSCITIFIDFGLTLNFYSVETSAFFKKKKIHISQ